MASARAGSHSPVTPRDEVPGRFDQQASHGVGDAPTRRTRCAEPGRRREPVLAFVVVAGKFLHAERPCDAPAYHESHGRPHGAWLRGLSPRRRAADPGSGSGWGAPAQFSRSTLRKQARSRNKIFRRRHHDRAARPDGGDRPHFCRAEGVKGNTFSHGGVTRGFDASSKARLTAVGAPSSLRIARMEYPSATKC
jgi:hypothetical protein